MTTTETTTTQIHRVYIKASAQEIWDAITKPEWTARYGYTGYVDYDLRPGGDYKVRATAFPPILPLLIGLGVWARRRVREREGVSKTRMRS